MYMYITNLPLTHSWLDLRNPPTAGYLDRAVAPTPDAADW